MLNKYKSVTNHKLCHKDIKNDEEHALKYNNINFRSLNEQTNHHISKPACVFADKLLLIRCRLRAEDGMLETCLELRVEVCQSVSRVIEN